MLTTKAHAPDGQPFNIAELRNSQGMVVRFMDWGATWLSAQIPQADGSLREAILGCGSPARYLQQTAYLGATVGRYANRIRQAYLSQIDCPLASNQGPHQLHGGPEGFSHRRWQQVSHDTNRLTYRLYSPEGDQGFPGILNVELTLTLNDDNRLDFCFTAQSDALTPLSLTNHAYFNLDGVQGDIRAHQLALHSSYFQPVDTEGLPDGECLPVNQTAFDFRSPKSLSQDFLSDRFQQAVGGYDHAFVLDPHAIEQPVATLTSTDGQLQMNLFSSEPALQVYTGNYLAGTPSPQGEYQNYQGIALEPGYCPDAANDTPPAGCWLPAEEIRQIRFGYHFISA
ncbi:galactose-1-epimerase [Rosenbergiella sp. S61]|uniref:Aldose 1-epimerase n=1 Tax=Rosenbergiella gaditana TaxID=2726987 RepID=A0ABS5SYV1_9GAMM|nr:galactose-1-epimerase [Rosenbergiella gaditana]MBT0725288.1 galactose-1-epimerase [Rosenbergiella gaditana]